MDKQISFFQIDEERSSGQVAPRTAAMARRSVVAAA
jgi:hypothetical protein